MVRRYAAFIALTALLVAGGSPARAVGTPVVVAGPAGPFIDYYQKLVVLQPGDDLTLVNADVFPHDVVALGHYGEDDAFWCEAFPPGECPLFWSALIGPGTTPVLGLENLKPTSFDPETGAVENLYDFFCTLHPQNMRGQILVLEE